MESVAEKKFLRNKTISIYNNTEVVTDKTTGEILREHRSERTKSATEPDYIKVYYRTMMAVNGIDDIPLSFLLGIAESILYANGDEKILFFNNKQTRRKICELCKVADNMASKYINRACKLGILFKTADRGVYEVNPWIIAKGKWEHIRQLQTSFDFVNGRWERIVGYEPDSE